MVERREEQIRVWNRDGREHRILVVFGDGPAAAMVGAMYEGGCAEVASGTGIAVWQATYVSPAGSDEGHVWFGNGRIDIEIESLRGIGIGSLLMLPLVHWAKSRPCNVPVVPINLQGQDAKTEAERLRRNRFYEKLGFEFDFQDQERSYGVARRLFVSDLITPDFKMSGEWQVETLTGAGSIFSL
ncbi:MAG: GNAT family N-acetyltransferase [Azonexaceae bacterium]|nr:GNAT family N-acetyltransferase [Azonexaceae bacterium]